MKNFSLSLLIMISISFMINNVYSQQWGLYTLYATKGGIKAYLIDTNSTSYHDWTFSSSKLTAYSAYLVPGDTLVRTYGYTSYGGMTGGGVTGAVQKVTWNGTVVWDFQYNSSSYTLHHDICPMPNGDVLMISYELKTVAQATQAGASSNVAIKAEKLIEVRPTGATTGTIVWEWHLWDHLCQNYNAAKDNYVTSIVNNPQLLNINYTTGPDLSDRWHMNGVDYNAALDQIVVSIHFMNEVYVIDHSTTTAEAASHTGGNSGHGGDFLYRWGNPTAYGATGTTDFNTVHDAHWVSSDNPSYPNYLCAYNNKGGTGGVTAIDVWNPPYNGYNYTLTLGSAYAPTTYSYRYTCPFTAPDEGNSQQLPNGNMLVSNFQGSIYEVNSSGTTVWTKTNANSTHAYRYTKCYVRGPQATAGVSSTSITAGTPITLSSSAISVTEASPTYTYSWSSNPPGFNSASQNPSDTPMSTTTYTVTITDTNVGCSDTASVTVNVTVGIQENNDYNNLRIFPNPTTGIININVDFTETNFNVFVYGLYGNLLLQVKNIKTIDLSSLSNGIYYLSIKPENKNTINKKLILIK